MLGHVTKLGIASLVLGGIAFQTDVVQEPVGDLVDWVQGAAVQVEMDGVAKMLSMEHLAGVYDPETIDDVAFELYEQFRPEIERGRRGWGQKGRLDLDLIRSLADQ